eukprot:15479603-Alexandrium_andersonii.AAC.1
MGPAARSPLQQSPPSPPEGEATHLGLLSVSPPVWCGLVACGGQLRCCPWLPRVLPFLPLGSGLLTRFIR